MLFKMRLVLEATGFISAFVSKTFKNIIDHHVHGIQRVPKRLLAYSFLICFGRFERKYANRC